MSAINKNIIEGWAKQISEGISDKKPKMEKMEMSTDLKKEFEIYKVTWKTLNKMQEIEQFDTDKAWNKLYSKIDKEKAIVTSKKSETIPLRRMLAFTASVAILVAIAGYYLTTQLGTITQSNNTLSAQLLSLPDGSLVHLNVNSEISYKKSFGKISREVSFNGEAFFDIAKDKNKPFIIKTQNSFIKVLGTTFNVDAKTEFVEVIVKTGKVEVYNNINQSEHVILLPGEMAVLNGKNKIEKVANSNENYLSWLNQKLVFRALPLSEVITDLMNTYHCKIELADTSISALKVTSTFDNDSIHEILESISLAFNLNVKKEGSTYILESN